MAGRVHRVVTADTAVFGIKWLLNLVLLAEYDNILFNTCDKASTG